MELSAPRAPASRPIFAAISAAFASHSSARAGQAASADSNRVIPNRKRIPTKPGKLTHRESMSEILCHPGGNGAFRLPWTDVAHRQESCCIRRNGFAWLDAVNEWGM